MVDEAQQAASGLKGRKNIYTCTTCGHHIVTVDVADGTTPFGIQCTALGCDGFMRSSMYRVSDQGMRPTHEWYRPLVLDLPKLSQGELDHVTFGGLLLRPREADRACRACGCTQLNACNPPCSWVEWDLCSRCDEIQVTRMAARVPPDLARAAKSGDSEAMRKALAAVAETRDALPGKGGG